MSLRAQTEAEAEVVHQLKEHQTELEADVEEKEKLLVSLEEERQAAERQLEEVKRRCQSCNSCRSERCLVCLVFRSPPRMPRYVRS